MALVLIPAAPAPGWDMHIDINPAVTANPTTVDPGTYQAIVVTASTTIAIVLGTPGAGEANWIYVRNEVDDRSGISVAGQTGTVDGDPSISLSWGVGAKFIFDGVNWWSFSAA